MQDVTLNSIRSTYSYRAADVSPAANPTDVLALVGANGKCIRVTKIGISGSATAAALVDLYITKRTAPNSGGTVTNPTATKYDSQDPNPSATLVLYSANASSLGTGSGLEGDKIFLAAQSAPSGPPSDWMVDYTGAEAKCPILRNAQESISINFAGAAMPAGASFYLYIEWTEEPGV